MFWSVYGIFQLNYLYALTHAYKRQFIKEKHTKCIETGGWLTTCSGSMGCCIKIIIKVQQQRENF